MEHRSDSQSLPSQGIVTGPVAAGSNSGVIFRRTIRLLLRRFLYLFMLLLRPLRRYAVFAAVVLALLGVVGWLGFQLWAPRASAVADTRAALIPPAEAVENYIKGQQNGNAELMWDALSPASQADQMGNGSSKATMQSRIDTKRQGGLQFNRYAYVGGQTGTNFTMYTYYVDVKRADQQATLPMTFLVDKSGKVINIISPDLLNDMAQSAQ